MKKILGTLVLVLLLGVPVLASPPVIVGDPASVGFSTNVLDTDSVTRSYMWFNVILSDTGSGSPANIGGVSLAAQVGGSWAAAHLSAPPNYGTGGVNSDNRFSGLQWATLIGAGNYAFGTADYPTSTSGAFGTIGSGGYLTFGIDNQSSLTTSVANGKVLARLYFGWDGTPLGANTISVSLIAESGSSSGQGPSIFAASSTPSNGSYVIGSEVFAAPTTFTISQATGTFAITATTPSNWVYQNTTTTTASRHCLAMTTSVTSDTWGNTQYTASVSVSPTPSGTYQGLIPSSTYIYYSGGINHGSITPTTGFTFAAGSTGTLYLIGGQVLGGGVVNSNANRLVAGPTNGNYTVTVTVVGNQSGPSNPVVTTCVVNVRILGDVDGNGTVQSSDKAWITQKIAGGSNYWPAGVDPAALDVDGNGTVQSADKADVTYGVGGSPIQ